MDLAEVEFFEGYCLFESNLTVKPSRDNLLFQQLQRIVLLLHSVQYPRPANDHLCLLLIQLQKVMHSLQFLTALLFLYHQTLNLSRVILILPLRILNFLPQKYVFLFYCLKFIFLLVSLFQDLLIFIHKANQFVLFLKVLLLHLHTALLTLGELLFKLHLQLSYFFTILVSYRLTVDALQLGPLRAVFYTYRWKRRFRSQHYRLRLGLSRVSKQTDGVQD